MDKNVFVLWLEKNWKIIGEIERHAWNNVYWTIKKDGEMDTSELSDGVVDVMHICIEYSETFLLEVKVRWERLSPKMVIVHSIVPIGTCKELSDALWVVVHHSPINGMNYRDVKYMFTQFTSSLESAIYLRNLWIEKVEPLGSREATETLKLLDLAYDAWGLLFAELARQICERNKLDFTSVYEDSNRFHNDACRKTNRNGEIRGVYNPPEGSVDQGIFDLLPDGKLKDIIKNLDEENKQAFIQKQADEAGREEEERVHQYQMWMQAEAEAQWQREQHEQAQAEYDQDPWYQGE